MRPVHLVSDTARKLAASMCMEAPDGWLARFSEPTRSLEQNALLWSRLSQLSNGVLWDNERLSAREWKDLLTACLRKQKVVRGIEGGLVFLGAHTSTMPKAEFNDLLALMDAFAAERGVVFQTNVSNVSSRSPSLSPK